MIVSFLRQIIVLLPVAYLLGKFGDLKHIWYAFPISETVSFVVLLILSKKVFTKVFLEMEEE